MKFNQKGRSPEYICQASTNWSPKFCINELLAYRKSLECLVNKKTKRTSKTLTMSIHSKQNKNAIQKQRSGSRSNKKLARTPSEGVIRQKALKRGVSNKTRPKQANYLTASTTSDSRRQNSKTQSYLWHQYNSPKVVGNPLRKSQIIPSKTTLDSAFKEIRNSKFPSKTGSVLFDKKVSIPRPSSQKKRKKLSSHCTSNKQIALCTLLARKTSLKSWKSKKAGNGESPLTSYRNEAGRSKSRKIRKAITGEVNPKILKAMQEFKKKLSIFATSFTKEQQNDEIQSEGWE